VLSVSGKDLHPQGYSRHFLARGRSVRYPSHQPPIASRAPSSPVSCLLHPCPIPSSSPDLAAATILPLRPCSLLAPSPYPSAGWEPLPRATSVFVVERQDEAATTMDGAPPLQRSPPVGAQPAAPRRRTHPAGGARAAAPRRRAHLKPTGGTAARSSSVVCSLSCRHTMSCR
jgi:hypothetical protein